MLRALAFVLLHCGAQDDALPPKSGDSAIVEKGAQALGALLMHPDPGVRDAAAAGLDALGPAVELAFPAILMALRDAREDGGSRATACALVRRLGPRAAPLVPELVSFGRSGEPDARAIVVEVLASIAPCVRGGEGFLSETVSTATGVTREQAARALLAADPSRTAARDLLSTGVRDGTLDRDSRLAVSLGRAGLDPALAQWTVTALADEAEESRRFAATLLAHLDARSGPAVGTLASGLLASSETVRIAVADALGRIGAAAEPAGEALERSLATSRGLEWLAVARALGRVRGSHGGTVTRVLQALEGDADVEDVAAALVEFEPEVAARELANRFDRGDSRAKVRTVALAASLVARDDLANDGGGASPQEARALIHGHAFVPAALALIVRAGKAVEAAARVAAVRAAAGLPDHDGELAPITLAALGDRDDSVRAAAHDSMGARAKRTIAPRELAKRLAEVPARGGDPRVLARSASELAGAIAALPGGPGAGGVVSGPPRYGVDELIGLARLAPELELAPFALRDSEFDALLAVVDGPDEVRARLAARALRLHSGTLSEAVTAALLKQLAEGPEFARIAAAELLDRRCTRPDQAIPALVLALGARPAVASAAASSLASHGAAAAVALAPALRDPSREVRARAIATLATMKASARPAVPALVACVGDADPELADAAAAALRTILDGR